MRARRERGCLGGGAGWAPAASAWRSPPCPQPRRRTTASTPRQTPTGYEHPGSGQRRAPRDHALDRQDRRLFSLVGAVDLLAVEERAPEVTHDAVVERGALAITGSQHLVLQAAGQADDSWLLGILGQERLALLPVAGSDHL